MERFIFSAAIIFAFIGVGCSAERTADGVPIHGNSYHDRDRNEPVRPAAAFFARFENRSTVDGGRNEVRSLDNPGRFFGQNGIQPYHRTSAAWSDNTLTRQTSRRSSSANQINSGDALAPSTFGNAEANSPNFSEEVTYRRTSSGSRASDSSNTNNGIGRRTTRKCVTTTINEDGSTSTTTTTNGNGGRRCIPNGNTRASNVNSAVRHRTRNNNTNFETRSSSTQTRSTNTATRSLQASSSNSNQGNSGVTCVTGNCRTGSSSPTTNNPTTRVTYHRRSRVPSSDFLLPSASDTQTRSLPSPLLQKLSRGDGQVNARVHSSANENGNLAQSHSSHSTQSASESTSEQHSQRSETSSRSQGSRHVAPARQAAQSEFRQGRKANSTYYRKRVVKNFTAEVIPSEETYSHTTLST